MCEYFFCGIPDIHGEERLQSTKDGSRNIVINVHILWTNLRVPIYSGQGAFSEIARSAVTDVGMGIRCKPVR
jgi:hypothetical protein